MAIKNDEVISTLNGLIEVCKDGQQGFQSAAEGITNTNARDMFLGYSRQRALFVGQLQNEVRQLGGDPEKTGSVAGALHRGWINIKSVVTGKDEHAILDEAERGEDSAVSNYESALKSDLPVNIQKLLREQYNEIKAAHDEVRNLRNLTKSAKR